MLMKNEADCSSRRELAKRRARLSKLSRAMLTPSITTPELLRHFAAGISWTFTATVGERAMGLMQSILIARVLGIEDYGRYGLLFVTIGWISSVVGLQLGLTATVEVARHRYSNSVRALAVVRLAEIMTLATVLLVAAAIWLHPETFGVALMGAAGDKEIVLLAGLIGALGVFTGIQESVVQGYEDFKALAIVRVIGAGAALVLVIAFGRSGGLSAVILALVFGAALRFVLVLAVKEFWLLRHGTHPSWQHVWQARDVLWSFSLPSVLASAVSGGVLWYGMVLLAGVKDGFQDIAVVTVGNQWRGVLLLGTSMLSSVAIPMLTRLNQQGDGAKMLQLHGYNLKANLVFTMVAAVVVGAAWQPILRAYGSEFRQGWPVFVVLVATAIPAAYANVLLQYLVSQGRMWRQLAYYLLSSAGLLVAYRLAIGAWGPLGFAAATLAVAVLSAIVLDRLLARELTAK
jgi:O-antigen/teichoic acid export membrane protein